MAARKKFWPGFTWRILAHRVDKPGAKVRGEGTKPWLRCPDCDWNGQDYADHPKECPTLHSRMNYSTVLAMRHSDFPESIEFDELVIDHWFHLEQMDSRDWWMRVGAATLNIHIDKDGRTRVTGYSEPDDTNEFGGFDS